LKFVTKHLDGSPITMPASIVSGNGYSVKVGRALLLTTKWKVDDGLHPNGPEFVKVRS